MKKSITVIALALAAPLVWGQTTTKTEKETTKSGDGTSTTTEKTTTTTAGGTITEYEAGKSIVLKEEAGPRTYRFGPKVVYVTKDGTAITEADVKTRIKVGAPVHVHYVKEGDGMVVSRVVVDE